MAAKHNISIECGATWRSQLIWKDALGARIALTGFTAKMQIRANVGDPVLIELSTTNGRILLEHSAVETDPTGVIDLLIADEDTALLEPQGGVYDLLLVSAGSEATRLVEGKALIIAGVTVQ